MRIGTLNDLPADAGGIFDVFVQVLKYHVFGDGTVGCGEVTPAPEVAAPIAFFQIRKFAEQFESRAPLDPTHQITDCDLRRDRDEDMNVIRRNHTLQVN